MALTDYRPRKQLRKIPFGYIVNPQEGGDPSLLIPDPAVIGVLDQALDQLDAGISLRQACEYVNANTPEEISLSHSGLKKLHLLYRPEFESKRGRPKVKKLTQAEKSERLRRYKIAQEKKRLAHTRKRIDKLKAENEILESNKIKIDDSLFVEVDYETPEFLEIEEEVEVVFKPNPGPQSAFFAASEQEVLYGGSAGGELKSEFLPPPFVARRQNKFRELLETRRGQSAAKL